MKTTKTISFCILLILHQFSVASSIKLSPEDLDKHAKLYPEIAHCEVIRYQEQYSSNGLIISKKETEDAIHALFNINPFLNSYENERKKFFKTAKGKLVEKMDPILYILTLKVTKKLYGDKKAPTIIRCVWEEGYNTSCPHVGIQLEKGKEIYIYSKNPLHSLTTSFQLGNVKMKERHTKSKK